MDLVLLERFRWLALQIKNHNAPYNQMLFFDHECGTACCLAGYGTQDPVLAAAGLYRFTMKNEFGQSYSPAFGPADHHYLGTEALARLLDLGDRQSDYIFGSVHEIADAADIDVRTVDITIDGVISRITRIMEGYLSDV